MMAAIETNVAEAALGPLVLAAFALSLLLTMAFAIQRATGKSGWVDTIWSLSVGIVGAATALAPIPGENWPTARQGAVALLALAWGARLGLHIMARTLKGGEDPRYAALAREWGEAFPRRFFWFLQSQAFAGWVLALAIFVAARNPAPFPGIGDALGFAVLVIAVVGEGVADQQLAAFRASGAPGRICDVGLWGVSRHPNYFFEWLAWVAWAIVAIGVPPVNAWGLIALLAPAFMYWLLRYVSGVPLLEAHMLRSRGAAFVAYQRRVNVFFPGPARKS
jgi:steroid 5-alpha reductase family enzyme